MWYHLSINLLKRVIPVVLILMLPGFCPAQNNGTDKIRHVVLITIDGMRSEMVSDPQMPSPTLKMIARKGIYVKSMRSVAPASTYPNHTSIVTGALPVHHGIYYNTPFQGNIQDRGVTNWFADSIKSGTIWKAAKEAGLSTCSLFWPVSTNCKDIDINFPEFWSIYKVEDQVQYIKDYSTPAGIFEEVESNATGKLTTGNFNPSTRNREARTAYMATYIFGKYRPALTTIHLINTDYFQHATGINSEETKMAVVAVDYAINQIIEGLERYKMLDSTVVIVCGDHGFVDTHTQISPNVWLKEAGLLSADPDNWRARFHGSGVTMFLYLKEKSDLEAVTEVRKKLNSLPGEKRGLFRIVEKDELSKLGCSPDVVLAVEPVKGVSVGTAMDGKDVISKSGGKHGYLLPVDPTALIAYGPGIPEGKIIEDTISITDVAPFVARLLNLDFKAPDGKFRQDLMKK